MINAALDLVLVFIYWTFFSSFKCVRARHTSNHTRWRFPHILHELHASRRQSKAKRTNPGNKRSYSHMLLKPAVKHTLKLKTTLDDVGPVEITVTKVATIATFAAVATIEKVTTIATNTATANRFLFLPAPTFCTATHAARLWGPTTWHFVQKITLLRLQKD